MRLVGDGVGFFGLEDFDSKTTCRGDVVKVYLVRSDE